MSRLSLTFACGRYDRMEPLRTGDVQVEGIDLNFLPMEAGREIFDRMVGGLEFDVSEMSSSEFISLHARGNSPLVALPVFPSRVFRHGFIYVNRRSGIKTAKDLEHKRVGVPLYTQTAALWIRGHLAHEYGVDLSTIRWLQGAVEKKGSHGRPHAPPLLKPANVEENTTSHSLNDLLADGKLDAVIGSRKPSALGHHPDVMRLFPDYRAIERQFYQKTRIFPIMHLVAMRRDVYERQPWIANSLFKAFVEAKNLALSRMRFSGATCYMLPWQTADVEELDELFGADLWPYGVELNRPTLQALVQYLAEQDFIASPMNIEDLFVALPGAMGS